MIAALNPQSKPIIFSRNIRFHNYKVLVRLFNVGIFRFFSVIPRNNYNNLTFHLVHTEIIGEGSERISIETFMDFRNFPNHGRLTLRAEGFFQLQQRLLQAFGRFIEDYGARFLGQQ